MLFSLRPSIHCSIILPLRYFCCKCSALDISFYRESFARRMNLAGIKPHHRIALGVSGGPDSMALCVLTAGWKSEGLGGKDVTTGCIDGLLGIIVDHRLRSDSAKEARIVQERVMKIGIKCEVSCCNWPKGRPKIGDLQEAARVMRYQIFQEICAEQQIGVLLVAHQADDQEELFILRLSRNSGIFGLACMAFVSQLFWEHPKYSSSGSVNHGVLLIRPMLEFSKDDMYKICLGGNQIWVEDPTNESILFVRNRIRIALRNFPSSSFSSQVHALVSTCQMTRLFIENICHKMLKNSVSIMDEGYGIIDLEKLDPSNVDDLSLSKFLVMILQYISQRQKPVRGSVMRLLVSYIRNIPCKTSLTAAGCYLCAAPQSKGKKIIVCCSPEAPFSSQLFLLNVYCDQDTTLSFVVEQIIRDAMFHSEKFVKETSSVPFLLAKSSEDILREALQLKLITQSTYDKIHLLQAEEREIFCSQNGVEEAYDPGHQDKGSCTLNAKIFLGQSYHFLSRFLVIWKLHDRTNSAINELSGKSEADGIKFCHSCIIAREHALTIRHMVDADWLYLASLSESQTHTENQNWCSSRMKSSVQTALLKLKQVPAAARRALPVFVNSHNLLLCIPSIGFSCCPFLSIVTEFKPRVPLGGGYRSYM